MLRVGVHIERGEECRERIGDGTDGVALRWQFFQRSCDAEHDASP